MSVSTVSSDTGYVPVNRVYYHFQLFSSMYHICYETYDEHICIYPIRTIARMDVVYKKERRKAGDDAAVAQRRVAAIPRLNLS